MLGNVKSFAASAAILLLTAAGATAEPVYTLNRQQTEAVALANLSPGGECLPDNMSGRIVSVTHNRQKTLPVEFSIANRQGAVTVINVDTQAFADASRLGQGWVGDGLQRMIRSGHEVTLAVKLCGAAGRVVLLDGVRRR